MAPCATPSTARPRRSTSVTAANAGSSRPRRSGCRCRECRKQSASAFGLSLIVRREHLRLESGEPRTWTRPTGSGGTLDCRFCPDCGTRVWHEDGPTSETVSVKAGSLDQPIDLGNAIHIWTCRALPGVVIPEGAARFETEPD